MTGLFGIANTSIFTLHKFYLSLKARARAKDVEFPKLKILGTDSSKVIDGQIIFVPSVALFMSKRALLNNANAIIFVFDCAVQLEYLKPIVILDLESKLESYCYRFKKLTEQIFAKALKTESDKSVKVSRQTVQIIPQLIGNIDNSVLSPVMKFLYCIPNALDRNRYSIEIAKWFFSNKSNKRLQKRLAKLSGLPSYFAVEDLLAFFASDSGKKLKQVAAEIGTPEISASQIKKIALKHKVKEFEVLYMSALYKKSHVKIVNKNSHEIDTALRERYAI